jgi:cbb3-type cytochrome oxidase maturation protein
VNIVYLLIPLGLVLVGIGLAAFFWAVSSGQFDDLDSPGWSVLTDDEPPQDAAGSQSATAGGGGDRRDEGTSRGKPES